MSGLEFKAYNTVVMASLPTNKSDLISHKNTWIFTKAPLKLYRIDEKQLYEYSVSSEAIRSELEEVGISRYLNMDEKSEATVVSLTETISSEQMEKLKTFTEACDNERIHQLALKKKAAKREMAKDVAIFALSATGTSILYTPASHFGEAALIYLLDSDPDTAHGFGIFCGVASVTTTAIVCLNAFRQLLAPSEATYLRRSLIALGGLSTSIPLMIDTFKVNKDRGRELGVLLAQAVIGKRKIYS